MQQAQRAQAGVNATIQETISGIAVAKNFRQEAAIYADFVPSNEHGLPGTAGPRHVFGSIYPMLHAIRGIATGS